MADNKKITNDERQEMIEQMDAEIEEHIHSLPKKHYKDGFSQSNWEKEMEQHPAFMTKLPENDEDLPPLVAAMQSLKYGDDNTPEELALSYKDDGNWNFKKKKYRWAVDSYSEGIKQKCNDHELNAILHSNRAAAHFYLGNYRTALNDAKSAREFKSDHMKAIIRGVECLLALHKSEEALVWCDEGLLINPKESVLKKLRIRAEQKKRQMERDNRKAAKQRKTDELSEQAIFNAIRDRKICLGELKDHDENVSDYKNLDLTILEPCHPASYGACVHLNQDGNLVWPVIFLYPEFGKSDFIQAFLETERFVEHLTVMFTEIDRPPWDIEKKYNVDSLQLWFEDQENTELIKINRNDTLLKVLAHKRIIIYGGTPTFIITVEKSTFEKEFLDRWN